MLHEAVFPVHVLGDDHLHKGIDLVLAERRVDPDAAH
jgi:hypothetical protein